MAEPPTSRYRKALLSTHGDVWMQNMQIWVSNNFTAFLLNKVNMFTELSVDDSIFFDMPVRPVRPAMPVFVQIK